MTLRDELAAWLYRRDSQAGIENSWHEDADALIAGPLRDLLAERDTLAAQVRAVADRAEVHYAGMQAVRSMPSDWYCPRSEPGRMRRDCPECVAEVALDAALTVVYSDGTPTTGGGEWET